MTYIIAGCGPAGLAATRAIRERDAGGDIVMLNPEGVPPYSRIALPDYAAGLIDTDGMRCAESDFFERHRVTELRGRALAKLLPGERSVILDDGSSLTYDRLLLCTGSTPLLPPFARCKTSGLYTLWNVSDAAAIRDALPRVRDAVVIGGGLAGMHTAQALLQAGKSVTVIERLDDIMAPQLDAPARARLCAAASRHGLNILTGVNVTGMETRDGAVRAVVTDRSELPTQLVIVSTGVRSNIPYLDGCTGLEQSALPVDEHMCTALPHVYAAGDIACAPDHTGARRVRALWPCAVAQGRVAGGNMADGDVRYSAAAAMNSLHLFDLPVISAGEFLSDSLRGLILSNTPDTYARLTMDGDTPVGFIIAGDVRQAGRLYAALGRPMLTGALRSVGGSV